MKFTLSWLKEHLDTSSTLDEILDALVMLGMEVEEVQDYLQVYKDFSIAYIKCATVHPNADKLKICMVDTKDGELQIVCGASNARAGIYVIYASVGTYIPALDVTLKQAEIRGVQSFGMMLSEKEMGISDEHGSIAEFSTGTVGDLAVKALNLDDVVIDISITPNRGDWLGVIGLARELASFGLGKLKPLPKCKHYENTDAINIKLNCEISTIFSARKIVGLKNISSPAWLQKRLKMIGLTPRSALVDITNYALFSLNQPMHAYDFTKLEDKSSIVVDFANKGTSFVALDNNEYILSDISPVVKMGEQINCIAGIKGSYGSCCDENTTAIILESAHFDAKTVALAKRELGINTDSSYRFERGIDTSNILATLDFATSLILEICGGQVEHTSIAGNVKENQEFEVSLDEINNLAGINFAVEQVLNILKSLGFIVKQENRKFMCTAPQFRNDIDVKETIIAEIIRLYGVNNIKAKGINVDITASKKGYDNSYERTLLARRSLAKLGMYESINMSFISEKLANVFEINAQSLNLHNPISEELKVMRKSIIPSLLSIAVQNINNGNISGNLFEVAPIYNESSTQENMVAGILFGNKLHKLWNTKEITYDAYDAKSMLFSLIQSLNFNPNNAMIVQSNLPSYYHRGKGAALVIGKTTIGYFGEISPLVLHGLDIKGTFIIFELFLDKLPPSKNKKVPLIQSIFLPIYREFAFIVNNDISAGDILRVVSKSDKEHIVDVKILDVYEGGSIPLGKKSVAISTTLQAYEKTFVDAEITVISDKIIASMVKSFGAILRDK